MLKEQLVQYENKTSSRKTTINGSFGKFGSGYSILYAPDLMVQVTVTGQLSVLMLIEMMEAKGISVISGNTDGIVLKVPKEKEPLMHLIIRTWEKRTGFNMESTKYAGIYSRDVNNYFAVKDNGKVKTKGCFGPADIDDKSPENEICAIAMIEYVKHGTSIETTIKACKDIKKFLMLRTVNGGAEWKGQYLGKAVRYYHANNESGYINYCENGNKVAKTDGVKPFMELNKPFPDDIDYEWYVNSAYTIFDSKKK